MKHLFAKGAQGCAHVILLFSFLSFTTLNAQQKGCEAQAADEEGMHSKPDGTLKDLFAQTAAKPQAFTFDAGEHGFAKCRGGTKVLVPSGSFIYADGRNVTGKIQLHITEVTRKGDLVLSNLPTISNGEMLVSGGVIRVEAFQDGQPLELAQDAVLYAWFPRGAEEGMELFDGAYDGQDKMNWTAQNASTVTETPFSDDLYDTEGFDEVEGDWGTEYYAAPYDLTLPKFMDYGLLNLRNGRFADSVHTVQGFLEEKLLEEYNCSGRDSVEVGAIMQWNGQIREAYYTKGWNPCYKRAIPEILLTVPVDTTGNRKQPQSLRFLLTPDIAERKRGDNKFISVVDRPLMYMQPELRAEVEKYLDKNGAQRFVQESFQIRSMRWINCDRFYEDNSPRVTMSAEMQNEDLRGRTRAFLIFTDINSAIEGVASGDGGTFTFPSIPAGMDARIVMLSYRVGQGAFMSTSSVAVHEGAAEAHQLRPITMEEMQATMTLL